MAETRSLFAGPTPERVDGPRQPGRRTGAHRPRRDAPVDDPDFHVTPPDMAADIYRRVIGCAETGWEPAHPDARHGPIWEPACGDGSIVGALRSTNRPIIASDLYDRGHGSPGADFLQADRIPSVAGEKATLLLTNPPFNMFTEFAVHGIKLGLPCVVLLGQASFIEGQRRHRELHGPTPPRFIYYYVRRRSLWRNGKQPEAGGNKGAMAFCWWVWVAGFKGETVTRWIV